MPCYEHNYWSRPGPARLRGWLCSQDGGGTELTPTRADQPRYVGLTECSRTVRDHARWDSRPPDYRTPPVMCGDVKLGSKVRLRDFTARCLARRQLNYRCGIVPDNLICQPRRHSATYLLSSSLAAVSSCLGPPTSSVFSSAPSAIYSVIEQM